MDREKHAQFSRLADTRGIVLLYHSISPDSRKTPHGTIHNIQPEVLDRHIADLSGFFRFVSLEEFVRQEFPIGLAALTFDDGYRNVPIHAGPILSRWGLEACMFLNTVTLSGRMNWRDKVRYIMRCKREQEFLQSFPLNHNAGSFYRSTKHPANNSAELDHAMDCFLAGKTIDLYERFPYLTRDDMAEIATDFPCLRFGNHSANHYVLSSLSDAQQKREIENSRKMLSSLPCRVESTCFSIPFGEDRDISTRTVQLLNQSGYDSMLMSRQLLQARFMRQSGIRIIDRFLPRTEDIISEILNTYSSAPR